MEKKEPIHVKKLVIENIEILEQKLKKNTMNISSLLKKKIQMM